MLCPSVVFVDEASTVVCLTVSKLLDKPSDTVTVRCDGSRWLKPVTTSCVSWKRSVVVERCWRKPCLASVSVSQT